MGAEEMERRGRIQKASWRQNQQNIGTGPGQREEPGVWMEKGVNSDVISWDTSSYKLQVWCGRGKMASMLEIMNLFGWVYGSRDEEELEEILIWELSATNHCHLNIFDISYLRHRPWPQVALFAFPVEETLSITIKFHCSKTFWGNYFYNHKIICVYLSLYNYL